MSSKRDLVEAHSFNRRRLVTAFTSGAPGGREVEAPRHGRTLIGGAVLALLVVVGAAVAGFFKPTVPEGWNQSGLVIGKVSGARFFAQDGTLYPVINTTSARLLMAPEDFKVRIVPDEKIEAERPGATIGIVGAPDVLPPKENLIQDGWTSCIDSTGHTRVRVVSEPGVRPATDDALLAEVNGATWVIAGEHRYAVPAGQEEAVLLALDLNGQLVWKVSPTWLNLFPEGSALGPLEVDGQGKPAPLAGLEPTAQRVGALVTDGQDSYVVLTSGLAPITPVEQELMLQSGRAVTPNPVEVAPAVISQVGLVDSPFKHTWPVEIPQGYGDTAVCALLDHERAGSLPVVRLATPTSDEARPGADVPAFEIEGGHGSLVTTTSGADTGTRYLVDASGKAYKLANQKSDVQWLLGYSDVDTSLVPPSWMSLFRPGPTLSSTQAAKQVGSSE